MNEYLENLGVLFRKYGIKDVYSYGVFAPCPMRNPMLYTPTPYNAEAKKEITKYLIEHSIDKHCSFNMTNIVEPDSAEMIYHDGKFHVREVWYYA